MSMRRMSSQRRFSPSPSRGGLGRGWCSPVVEMDRTTKTIPTQTLPLKGRAYGATAWGQRRIEGFAATRLLKWIGIAFLALILVTGALLFWLLDTESGAR